jgi:hypothetical protein
MYKDSKKETLVKKIEDQFELFETISKENKNTYDQQIQDVYNIYKEKFKGDDALDLTKLMETKEYDEYKATKIYAMGFTKESKLSSFFHALSVIKCEDKSKTSKSKTSKKAPIYLLISHYNRGQNIVQVFPNFPYIPYEAIHKQTFYGRSNFYLYITYKEKFDPTEKLILSTDDVGGIICQGKTKTGVNIKDICKQILAWWYINDVYKRSTTFPGSCTGLTETMMYLTMKPEEYQKCIAIKLTTEGRKIVNSETYPLKLN